MRILAKSLALSLLLCGCVVADASDVVEIGSRLEMFVDHHLIERMENTRLKLHTPRDAGEVLTFDEPWEGPFVGYLTVIQNDGKYQLFYRGKTAMTRAGAPDETTGYAESADGIHWTRPDLGLYEVRETT